MTVAVENAKAALDELLDKALQGQDVVITREDGKTFKLVAWKPVAPKRGGLGSAKGVRIAEDFKDIPEGFSYMPPQ